MSSTENTNAPMPAEDKVDLIVDYADEIKAERIEKLDVRAKTSVADFFVVCTRTSDTHLNAIVDRVVQKMRERGVKALRTEDRIGGSGWVLLDFGDVVFHAMREERRQFYDLESLWTTMQPDPNLP